MWDSIKSWYGFGANSFCGAYYAFGVSGSC